MLSLLIRLHERSRMRLHKRSRMRSRKHSNVHFYVSVFSVHCLRMRSCASDSRLAHIHSSHSSRTTCFWLTLSLAHQHRGSAWVRAHSHLRSCTSVFLLRFSLASLRRSQKESCGELRSRTEPCFRICKRRRRRLHKTIHSQAQIHMDVCVNVDARSVAFSRARPLCGQSLPLLPIATAGAQNAPASFLVSLRSQTKKKAAVKNSCKVSLEERIRILIRIHIRILIFIRIRIKISSIFVL